MAKGMARALVTGATSGIGRAIALALHGAAGEAGEGQRVVGRGVEIDDFPLLLPEVVDKFLHQRRGGESAFAAADDFVFPVGHKS